MGSVCFANPVSKWVKSGYDKRCERLGFGPQPLNPCCATLKPRVPSGRISNWPSLAAQADPQKNNKIWSLTMVSVSLKVNGNAVTKDVEDRMLLVEFLRNELNLTGTHVGCDTSQCGACVVHVDGEAMKSCSMLAVQADGAEVTTIEGLAEDGGKLHPVQAAFQEYHGLQCGFCTPGMIMTSVDMIRRNPDLDEETIRHELEGNICRCTGYQNIVRAVKAASDDMRG